MPINHLVYSLPNFFFYINMIYIIIWNQYTGQVKHIGYALKTSLFLFPFVYLNRVSGKFLSLPIG